MRLTEILYRHNTSAKRQRARHRVGSYSDKNLTRLAQDATKESQTKHFNYLDWSRAFLSKSRYMCGLQCPKRLWQAVYDPEPAEEPLPGTAKGMGIEVGIKARLLWPGGVLVDDPGHHGYDAAVRCTKTLIADSYVLAGNGLELADAYLPVEECIPIDLFAALVFMVCEYQTCRASSAVA